MFNIILSYAAAIMTFGIAVVAILRDPHSFVHRVFAGGMLVFAVAAGFVVFVNGAPTVEAFLWREWLRYIVLSFGPAFWLTFSLCFARANYQEQLAKWKVALVGAGLLPLLIALGFRQTFFASPVVVADSKILFIGIGGAAYIWHLIWIIFAVIILMNLEKTFRQATGHLRWQTKFMFLGVGCVLGVRLFTGSQILMYKGYDPAITILFPGSLLLSDLILVKAFFRGKPLAAKVHFSHQLIQTSFTAFIVGAYFCVVGLMAWFSLHLEWITNIQIIVFLIFVAILGVAVLLLSDRLRVKRKRFISRHFKRPIYDYQKIWETFTQRTILITQSAGLCETTVKMVSDTLEILAVTIWLIDEERETLVFGASTVMTENQAGQLTLSAANRVELIEAVTDQAMPIDLEGHEEDWALALKRSYAGEGTKEARVRYCVPLNAGEHLVGIMTLSEKVFYESLSFEDLDLVRSIADQAAAMLLNIRLSDKLRQVRELEAFQAMSAFFIHDLKNLASKLSLVAQNLPLHLDNPEFRSDAIKAMGQSVDKINGMSSRLTMLSEKLILKLRDIDLSEFVSATLTEMNGLFRTHVNKDLQAVSVLRMDPDEMKKVLENLLLNATDATGGRGDVRVETSLKDKWAVIAVIDNGCGMTREFIERDLFRPFRTTKPKGMGIGLFHCKTIVEAHGGKMEVESKEGKGTTFRVLLPIK